MEKQKKLIKKENPEIRTSEVTSLIRFAIEKDGDLDKLEKLLQLKRDYEKDEARKAYHKAMAEFKANPPKITKDREVAFDTSKGHTSYKHATLGNVTDKISEALSKHDLSAAWFTQQDNQLVKVTCRITHALGHYEETTLAGQPDISGSKNPIQATGSTVTYLQRYTILSLTGLATFDQDDDGAASAARPGVDTITESQKHAIVDMLTTSGAKEKRLLEFLRVSSIDEIPKSRFEEVVGVLQEQKKRIEKKKAEKEGQR